MPRRAVPAMTYRSERSAPRLDGPCLPYQAGRCHAWPRPAIPCLRCQAHPHLVSRCPAMPHHACFAMLGLARHGHAMPAFPFHTVPLDTTPRLA